MDSRRWEFLCILVVVIVVMISAVHLVLSHSQLTVNGTEIWIGWIWWGIIVITISAFAAELLSLPIVQRRLQRR